MGSPQRTHLLPFTRCDRGMTQQIPFYQSLAPSHLEIPDSIIVLPNFYSNVFSLPDFFNLDHDLRPARQDLANLIPHVP